MLRILLKSSANDMLWLLFWILMPFNPILTSEEPLSCRDENGLRVDWYVLYKLPQTGACVYRSSATNPNQYGWTACRHPVNYIYSSLGRTLVPLYQALEPKGDRLVVMYNDEFPNGTSSETAAHAKGVVAFNTIDDGTVGGGFWMAHSIPRFPPASAPGAQFSFPPTGLKYGQTVLCLSMPVQQANSIGSQLQFYHPFVYHWEMAIGSLSVGAPDLVDVAIHGRHRQQAPWSNTEVLTTIDGLKVWNFAKASQFGKDIYADWMGSALKAPLRVESWTNGGGGVMPSRCDTAFFVENVCKISLDGRSYFTSHHDHSKWAIAYNSSSPWICIADINRMVSQQKRGGGSLCFQDTKLWQSFSKSIADVEPCPMLRPHSMPSK